MEVIIDEIEIESLDRGDGIVFLTSLQNFKKILEQKIAALEVKLGKDEYYADLGIEYARKIRTKPNSAMQNRMQVLFLNKDI